MAIINQFKILLKCFNGTFYSKILYTSFYLTLGLLQNTNLIKITVRCLLYFFSSHFTSHMVKSDFNQICHITGCLEWHYIIIQWKWRLRDYQSVTKFCIQSTIWSAENCHNHLYYIIYSWHKVNHMWPVMGFSQISHAAKFQ